jgi:hypothetical protein
MKTNRFLLILFSIVVVLLISCSKDKEATGDSINYVVKATWDNPADHIGELSPAVTNLSLTTPSGGNSVSLHSLTPVSIGTEWGPYPAGMTVKVTAESVLTHVSVTVEIWRNGVLWKNNTAVGGNYYAVATATGTL